MIATTLISILTIALAVFGANRFLPFKICSVCAGVAGTWMWLLAGIFLGHEIDPLIPAVLMGGSVVGIYYQIKDKLLPRLRNRKLGSDARAAELKKKMDGCC